MVGHGAGRCNGAAPSLRYSNARLRHCQAARLRGWQKPCYRRFVSRIAELRAVKGLTQPQLAKRVGASLRTVQGWETDGRQPMKPYREKLARVLGVTEGDLGFDQEGTT